MDEQSQEDTERLEYMPTEEDMGNPNQDHLDAVIKASTTKARVTPNWVAAHNRFRESTNSVEDQVMFERAYRNL